jgi:hypothetical protein
MIGVGQIIGRRMTQLDSVGEFKNEPYSERKFLRFFA